MQKKNSTTNTKLKRGLKPYQLSMISIGGVIGVGMFLGSGATVKLGGPGVIISYALGGVIMMLVMFALAEMTVADPVPGSFRTHAANYLHPYFGFVVGWLYWFSWVTIMAAEIVAASTYMSFWFSSQYTWFFGVIFALAMTLVNLRNVESFGLFEFWLSMIKVIAIIVFIIIGAGAILGIGVKNPIGLTHYFGQGGFFPHGFRGIVLSMAMVMVSYAGTEVIGVAAGETQNPETSVPRAIKGIIFRTLVFYIGSITILVGVMSWTNVGLEKSPFVLVYQMLGIPGSAHIMNFVVITAALSGMNCGLYTSSRMLYSLAKDKQAPKILTYINGKNNIPTYCVLASTFFLYIGVAIYYLSPEQAFLYITGISIFGSMFTWIIICITQIYFRKKISFERLRYKTPGYPWTSWIAIISLVGVIITLWFIPAQRIGIISGVIGLIITSIAYFIFTKVTHIDWDSKDIEKGIEFASYLNIWNDSDNEK